MPKPSQAHVKFFGFQPLKRDRVPGKACWLLRKVSPRAIGFARTAFPLSDVLSDRQLLYQDYLEYSEH